MKIPQRIEDVFIQTRIGVRAKSNNQQSPQEWSQLTGKFYFAGPDNNATSNAIAQPVSQETFSTNNSPRGTAASEFEIRNMVADMLRSGYTVTDVLNSRVPIRYLHGIEYHGGIIFDIDEKDSTGLLVSPFDLARGGKVTWNEAKELCNSFVNGGYDDWLLPSKSMLEIIYTHLAKSDYGDFASSVYWSASESGYNHAWGKSFSSGGNYDFDKTSHQYVRAIRTFSLK
jgi:hypothetical protein